MKCIFQKALITEFVRRTRWRTRPPRNLPSLLPAALSVQGLPAVHLSHDKSRNLFGAINHRITESQNGRGWKGPLWSSSPPPLPKQGLLQQAAQDLVQWVFNISREGDSTTSLGSLFQCSVTLRGKKFLLMLRRNFLCFRLYPLPLVLSLGTTEKSLAPSS